MPARHFQIEDVEKCAAKLGEEIECCTLGNNPSLPDNLRGKRLTLDQANDYLLKVQDEEDPEVWMGLVVWTNRSVFHYVDTGGIEDFFCTLQVVRRNPPTD